jgi:hypothetical protein
MEKRYQIRVGTNKVDFHYDADTQTWRARRPGTQDYTTGQAGTLEAARDAVRHYIEDGEPAGESLRSQASPAGTRHVPRGDRPGTGRRRKHPIPQQRTARCRRQRDDRQSLPRAGRGRDCAEIRGNSVPQSRLSGKVCGGLRLNHHQGSLLGRRLPLPDRLRDYPHREINAAPPPANQRRPGQVQL